MRFEILTAVTVKITSFLGVLLSDKYLLGFVGTFCLHGRRLGTLKMEAVGSSETLISTLSAEVFCTLYVKAFFAQ
jgi:hypothetical protein